MKKLIIFLVSLGLLFFNSFVIMKLWNWFIAPLGVINVTLFHALGIDIFVTKISPHDRNKNRDLAEKTNEELVELFVYLFVFAITSLGLGFIAQLFI